MNKLLLVVFFILICLPAWAQENKSTQEKIKVKSTVTQKGEIKLDDLHLEALIEKPSVSILPKRIKPDLENVEFITRKFDRELKMVPEKLFDKQLGKKEVQKIRDIDKILKKNRE